MSQSCARVNLPPRPPQSSAQNYRYQPVKRNGRIRLLHLKPGSGEDALSCSLRIVSLSKAPPYEAISYAWGDPVFSASILCSRKCSLAITENLSAALYQFRYPGRERVLWVDAICINQQDVDERNRQIRLMSSIYGKAKQVLVWLGEDTGDASSAFEGIQEVHSHILERGSMGVTQLWYIIDDRQANALDALLHRPWFMRVWIVQEIISARQATIVCGNRSIDWLPFLRSMTSIYKSHVNFMYRCSQLNAVFTQLASIYVQWDSTQKRALAELVNLNRTCKASDLRDKVFALVGLAADGDCTAYGPDYSKDVLEVYRDLASYSIVEKRCANVLTMCKLSDGVKFLLLPSWVPDWSRGNSLNPSPYTCPQLYRASADYTFSGTMGKDPNVLLLDGVLLNKTEVLGRPCSMITREPSGSRDDFKTIHEIHEEYLDMFRHSHRYKSDYWNAFIRAFVTDQDHDGKRMEGRDLSHVYVNYRRRVSGKAWACQKKAATGKSVKNPVEHSHEVIDFANAIAFAGYGRTFCLFDDGRAGWVPDTAKIGDQVAIFLGAEVPILLRPQGDAYLVVGETYVHEMMDGQAFEDPEVEIETIKLV